MHFYEGTDMQLLIHSYCYGASNEGSSKAGSTDIDLLLVSEIFRWYLIRLTKFIINQTELYNESEVISYLVIVTWHKWLTGV